MNEMSGVFAIILASGQSTRMGEPKLLLPWRGATLIEHILTKAASFPFEGVKVVIPEGSEPLQNIISAYPFDPIYNSFPQLGIGQSLSLAVRSLPSRARAVLILLGDQPRLNTEDIQKISELFQQLSFSIDICKKCIIQMKYRDGFVGHPVLFTSHFFSELKAITGDIGGKGIIQKNRDFLYYCNSENVYPKDIDTPDDYKQLIDGDVV